VTCSYNNCTQTLLVCYCSLGDSGGPLLDRQGRLIGITSWGIGMYRAFWLPLFRAAWPGRMFLTLLLFLFAHSTRLRIGPKTGRVHAGSGVRFVSETSHLLLVRLSPVLLRHVADGRGDLCPARHGQYQQQQWWRCRCRYAHRCSRGCTCCCTCSLSRRRIGRRRRPVRRRHLHLFHLADARILDRPVHLTKIDDDDDDEHP
jgi:hypothetical protein